MSDFVEVWRSSPPFLAVESAEVEHHGRAWTQHRVVVGDDAGGVVMVALRGGTVGLVRVWRPAVGESRLELPRGMREGADPEDDARRELLEETGHAAVSARKLGELDLDTSLVPTRIHVFKVVIGEGSPGPSDGEVDEVVWVEASELPRLVAEGVVRDGISLAALAMWAASGGSSG
ncbi:NUDIX hydrolase [Nocardioides sp.]|uniref:NUDIX hydrolase n=1 Tax=Nocardioides sp. TaxID=35761 RepID=UPI002629B3FE|nr:NUDIX hydrolase [Nocardioides sp.]